MAMPLSEEPWRPTSCSCRGRSGLGGREAPGTASPGARAAPSPGPSCDVLAEDEDCSGHAASRLLALTSEWLASDDELDRLRSSPGRESRPALSVHAVVGQGTRNEGWGSARGGRTSAARPAAVREEAEPLLQLQGFQGLLGPSLLRGPPGAGVCGRQKSEGADPGLCPQGPGPQPWTAQRAQHSQCHVRLGPAPRPGQRHRDPLGAPLPTPRRPHLPHHEAAARQDGASRGRRSTARQSLAARLWHRPTSLLPACSPGLPG